MHKPALVLFTCLLASTIGPALPQNGGIAWLDNYGEALRQAKQTGKPIFLEFRCEP